MRKAIFIFFVSLTLISCSKSGSLISQMDGKCNKVTDDKVAVSVTFQQDKAIVDVGGVTFNMIKVESGTFQMGSDNASYTSAAPAHTVTLSTYYICETVVIQDLWNKVMGTSTSSEYGYPKQYVTWKDCQTFIGRLNLLSGMAFALPTEAQWEFAARGGNKSHNYKYAGSNDIDAVAWYKGNSYGCVEKVALKKPNELGLYDMSGNMKEWCLDYYGSYESSAVTDPTGPTKGKYHVLRGGAYNDDSLACSVIYRMYDISAYSMYGFRLVLNPY